MRILVVEDDRKVASFIRKGLEEEGHAVEVAGDVEFVDERPSSLGASRSRRVVSSAAEAAPQGAVVTQTTQPSAPISNPIAQATVPVPAPETAKAKPSSARRPSRSTEAAT